MGFLGDLLPEKRQAKPINFPSLGHMSACDGPDPVVLKPSVQCSFALVPAFMVLATATGTSSDDPGHVVPALVEHAVGDRTVAMLVNHPAQQVIEDRTLDARPGLGAVNRKDAIGALDKLFMCLAGINTIHLGMHEILLW